MALTTSPPPPATVGDFYTFPSAYAGPARKSLIFIQYYCLARDLLDSPHCTIRRLNHGKVNQMNARIRYCLTFPALLLCAALCHATPFQATLSGLAEFPPNDSPGTGTVMGSFDLATHVLTLDVSFSALEAPATMTHIHCCTALPGLGTAGVASPTPTFPGFPLGVTSGTYNATFDTSLPTSWNGAFLEANGGTTAGAEQAFNTGLLTGRAYFNIHTSEYPAGEIRGFLQPVPEPSKLAMWGVGLAGVVAALRRRRKAQASQG